MPGGLAARAGWGGEVRWGWGGEVGAQGGGEVGARHSLRFQVAVEECGHRGGVLLSWWDTPSCAPAPCFTAGQCHHGYFQYFAGNDVFVMFYHWQFAHGFCQAQTGPGRWWFCKHARGARPGPPHFRAWRGGLGVHTPLGRRSEAKATRSGISWLPTLPGQSVSSVSSPGHHWGLIPGARPTRPWTSGQIVTSPHPIQSLLAPSSPGASESTEGLRQEPGLRPRCRPTVG